MRYPLTIGLLLVFSVLQAQFTMEATYGYPFHLDDLNTPKITTASDWSWTAGAKYMPGNIGIGLQYGLHNYTAYKDILAQLETIPNTISERPTSNWRVGMLAIGPVLRLGKSGLNLECFPKLGLANIQPPTQQVIFRDGVNERLLYRENHEEAGLADSKLFYGIDGRLNVGLTPTFGLSLSLGYHTNAGIGEGTSLIYRELENTGPNTSLEEIDQSRLLQHDCTAYSLLSAGIGVTITFGRKKKSPPDDVAEDVLPPQPRIPEDQATIAARDTRELRLEWSPEEPEVEQANYNVFLYEQTADGDSLVFQSKTRQELQLDLPENLSLRQGATYRWQVQAVDHARLSPCPDDCFSIYFEFTIDGLGLPQFYQLLDRNVGAAVPTGSKLRFLVDPGLFYGEEVRLLVLDERNEQRLESSLESGRLATWLVPLGDERFEMDLAQLTGGQQYTLEVSNGKRRQYLRFYQPQKGQRNE